MALNISVSNTVTKDAGSAIQKGTKRYLRDGADVGFAHSQELVPEDRGTLRQSGYPPEWTQDGAIRWGYRASHAMPIEKGTDPFYPPIQPLLEWSQRVSGGTGLGWYVARIKIPNEGIDAQPFAQPGAEKQKQWYDANEVGRYINEELK